MARARNEEALFNRFFFKRSLLQSAAVSGMLAIAVPLLVSCGSAHAAGGSLPEKFAEQILNELSLPAGTRIINRAQLPAQLDDPWQHTQDAADESRAYRTRTGLTAAATFFSDHRQDGVTPAGIETAKDRSRSFYFKIRDIPADISSAELDIDIVKASSGPTLIAAHIHIVPRAERPDSEHLVGSDFKDVRINVAVYGRIFRRETRIFASKNTIGDLVGDLNSLKTAPVSEEMAGCPGNANVFTLTFEPARSGGPRATVQTASCMIDQITINGTSQAPLDDPGDAIAHAASELTDIGQFWHDTGKK